MMNNKVNNVPKLRFKEFSGEWVLHTLDYLCDEFKSGKTITSKDIYQDGEYPVYGGNGLRGYTDNYTHDDNLVLIGRQGALCGNLNRVSGKSFISEHAIVIKDNNESNLSWLFYRLGYLNLNNYSESSAQPGLSVNKIKKIKVFSPSKQEQQKIAEFLSSVDSKLQSLKQKHQLLQQYKKGMMQKLFSQQIRFKDENGQDYQEWGNERLSNIAEINPKNDKLPLEFIYIDLESVDKGRLVNKKHILLDDAPSRAQRVLTAKDILFQLVRPYQQNNLLFNLNNDNYVASTGYAQIRTKQNTEYLYQFLHTDLLLNKVLELCTGTSYPAISSNDLGSINILVCSLQEQQKIANFLSAIDKKIDGVTKQIEQTALFKKGLLQQLFV